MAEDLGKVIERTDQMVRTIGMSPGAGVARGRKRVILEVLE